MIWTKIIDAEPVRNIKLEHIELVLDDDDPDRIEIYLLDRHMNRVEGGGFNLNDFIAAIVEFYNREY